VQTKPNYSIAELSRLTGVSIRTIRYYLSQGLLPAPGEAGPGAHYTDGHLDRLRLVKRLQQQHLPLAEIRSRLAGLTDADVASLAAEPTDSAAPSATSALEYVRAILGRDREASPPGQPSRSLLSRMVAAPAASPDERSDSGAPMQPPPTLGLAEQLRIEPQPLERSQWERLSLGPNVELHIRRPLSRLEQKRVERLITIARQVLKEDTP
jgi:DNA-binding transcriptional MerR regulator